MHVNDSKQRTEENYEIRISLIKEKNTYSFRSVLYKKENIVDICITPPITDDIEKAREIFCILTKNKVFPCHMCNIIDELM